MQGGVHGDILQANQDNAIPTTDGLDNVRRAIKLTAGAHAIEVKTSPDTSNSPVQVRLNWYTPEQRKADHEAAIAAAKKAKIALQFHREHGKKLTLTAVRPPGRFGELAVDGQSRITQFNEKPQATEGRINGGFFVASTRIFDLLRDSDGMMFEQEPLRALAREGQLMAWQHNGFWQPMDTFQESTLLNKMWAEGNAPWKTW